MEKRQEELISRVESTLEDVLLGQSSIGPFGLDYEAFNVALSKLSNDYPNQATLDCGRKLLQRISEVKKEKNFKWIDRLESITVFVMCGVTERFSK